MPTYLAQLTFSPEPSYTFRMNSSFDAAFHNLLEKTFGHPYESPVSVEQVEDDDSLEIVNPRHAFEAIKETFAEYTLDAQKDDEIFTSEDYD